MSVMILDDNRFDDIARKLNSMADERAQRQNRSWQAHILGFGIKSICLDIVTRWRALNYKSYNDKYNENVTPDAPVKFGKEMSTMQCYKSLGAIRYNIECEAHVDAEAQYFLKLCIDDIAHAIVTAMPEYSKSAWS